MGHFYRSMTLAQECKDRGHNVHILGNVMFTDYKWEFFQVRPNHRDDLYFAFENTRPDWLVIDLQHPPGEHIYELCDKFKVKTMLLNGVGREWDGDADIAITQGYSDGTPYSGADYVILRPEVYRVSETIPRGDDWFVWGGSSDRIGLTQKFHDTMGDTTANIAVTEFTPQVQFSHDNHFFAQVQGDEILPLMARAGKACIAMGMVAWELSIMKVPIYAFSISEGHLRFAQGMEREGLLKAYPEVGLPEEDIFVEFLQQDFEPSGDVPDGKACERIIDIMKGCL